MNLGNRTMARRIYVDVQFSFVTECSGDKMEMEEKACDFVDSLESGSKEFTEVTVENLEWEEGDEWY